MHLLPKHEIYHETLSIDNITVILIMQIDFNFEGKYIAMTHVLNSCAIYWCSYQVTITLFDNYVWQ